MRETDTLDTFVCSSWYYLRYVDPKNSEAPFDKERISKMLPVDKYVGGPEHATMHLLYARFITKALRDMGYINIDEPFKSLTHQGDILGSDGKRMSKSRPEFAIAPDEYTEKYGSDVLRLYLAFGFSYVDGGKWDDNGFYAIVRFVSRIERLIDKFSMLDKNQSTDNNIDNDLEYTKHNTIKSMTYGTERFQFNTSVARLMEFTSILEKKLEAIISYTQIRSAIEDFIKLSAPYAPHLAEELWQKIGNPYSIFDESYPTHDESKLHRKNIEMVVQINGKIRTKINVPRNSDKSFIENLVLNNKRVQKLLQNVPIKKIIIVSNKIVNIVV
jgi:leucyl-tRNA synthetase